MKLIKNFTKLLPVLALLALLAGCNSNNTPLREVFRKQTPYEKYEQSLRNADLDKTALGQDWLLAGRRVLRDSIVIAIPFQETGYFAADKPAAYSYRIDARRGERIVVRVDVQAQQPVRLFVDVFQLGGVPEVVASSDTSANTLDYEVDEDRQHLVRVQPELLRSGRYTISVTSAPSLGFPVAGKDDRAIGSFWGVARDGGRRKHEGVDIFAKRGTPVARCAASIPTTWAAKWCGSPTTGGTRRCTTPTSTSNWCSRVSTCGSAIRWAWWATRATPPRPSPTCTLAFTATWAAP
jgi:hypothetical protein